MGRSYLGVDATAFKSGRERKTIEAIDVYLRDLSRGASANQPATTQSAGGTSLGASYLTVANETALSAERKISIASPLTGSDGGANNSYSIGLSTAALAALLGAVPTFSYGTTFTAGSASTFIRTDAQHQFPSALMSTANSSTLICTDVVTDQVLTGSLGRLDLRQPNGWGFRATAGAAAANAVISVTVDPSISGLNVGMTSNFLGGTALTGMTLRAWDARYSSMTGVFNTCVFEGYGTSLLQYAPSATSGTDLKGYGVHIAGPAITSSNGGWTEVAGAYFEGPRTVISNPLVTLTAGIIVEPGTIGVTSQAGIYVRQRAANKVAANRYGILIDAMNSGTVKWGAKINDQVDISAQAANVQTVLSLHQLAVGGVAGAHVNFDDKAGNPPAPVTGDLWRNGDSLWFRQAAVSVDLTAAAAAATPRSYWMPTFLHMGA